MRDLPAVLRACGSRHHELYDKIAAQADFKKVLLQCYRGGDRTQREIGQCGFLAKLLGAS
ncbi:hypothetical protein NKJ40_25745 [Mesorhizobium sp. M0119]